MISGNKDKGGQHAKMIGGVGEVESEAWARAGGSQGHGLLQSDGKAGRAIDTGMTICLGFCCFLLCFFFFLFVMIFERILLVCLFTCFWFGDMVSYLQHSLT